MELPGFLRSQKTRPGFDDSDARALHSEVLSIRLPHSKTTIPLPEVFAFSDTRENKLNCPFILMEYVEGKPLYDVWFDRTSLKEVVHERRTRFLQRFAAAMKQLGGFSFDKRGSLIFDDQNRPRGIGPTPIVDFPAMIGRLENGIDDDMFIYRELGPFSDTKEYYTAFLDDKKEPETDLGRGAIKLVRMLNRLDPRTNRRKKASH